MPEASCPNPNPEVYLALAIFRASESSGSP